MIDSHTNLTNLTKSTCYARACHPAAISSKLHSFMPINRQPSQPTLLSRRRFRLRYYWSQKQRTVAISREKQWP